MVGLFLAAGPIYAQKISIDYDKDYDSSSIKTFAWAETSKTSLAASNPLLHSRILNGIEYYLTLEEVREVGADPDIYVTYHTSSKQKIVVNTTDFGYGYPRGWGHYGRGPYYGASVGTSTFSVNTYQMGTLVVDVWDAGTKTLVWRGMATNITVTDNPEKMKKRINKALKKMVNKWAKIKAKNLPEEGA